MTENADDPERPQPTEDEVLREFDELREELKRALVDEAASPDRGSRQLTIIDLTLGRMHTWALETAKESHDIGAARASAILRLCFEGFRHAREPREPVEAVAPKSIEARRQDLMEQLDKISVEFDLLWNEFGRAEGAKLEIIAPFSPGGAINELVMTIEDVYEWHDKGLPDDDSNRRRRQNEIDEFATGWADANSPKIKNVEWQLDHVVASAAAMFLARSYPGDASAAHKHPLDVARALRRAMERLGGHHRPGSPVEQTETDKKKKKKTKTVLRGDEWAITRRSLKIAELWSSDVERAFNTAHRDAVRMKEKRADLAMAERDAGSPHEADVRVPLRVSTARPNARKPRPRKPKATKH